MNTNKPVQDYWLQIGELRVPLQESQKFLSALHSGQVDGVVLHGPQGAQVYSLKGANDCFRLVMECMNEGAMLLTEDGAILYGNRKGAELLACPRERIIGADFAAYVALPYRKRLAQLLDDARQGLSGKTEVTLNCPDNQRTPIQLSMSPLDLDGTPAVCAVLTDLTESKQAAAALRKFEQLATVGRMAAQVVHEINSPLAGIKNAFQLIKRDLPAGHQYEAYVPRIEKEIARIAGIVLQTFQMCRPQDDDELQPLASIIGDVLALQEFISDRRGAQMDAQIDPECANILLPDQPLRQILFNLIRNALDVSPEGGIVRIAASTVPEGHVRIAVLDGGPGIPEEVRPHVFKPFFTTKTSCMGLGLSICQDIVADLGGTLTFRTELGRGTEFIVQLPCQQGQNHTVAPPE